MDLESLQWDPMLLSFFELTFNLKILPKIVSSCEIYSKLASTSIKVIYVVCSISKITAVTKYT